MRNILIASMLGIFALGQTPQTYQPMGVNTGMWQVNTVVNTSGQAAAMQSRLNGPLTNHSYQSCLTTDELNQGSLFNPDKKQCTQTVLNSSSTVLEVQVNCQYPNVQTSVHLTLTASDSSDVTGTGTTTLSANGRTMTSNTQFTAKWLSGSCTQ